jgi:hypothetical protein
MILRTSPFVNVNSLDCFYKTVEYNFQLKLHSKCLNENLTNA